MLHDTGRNKRIIFCVCGAANSAENPALDNPTTLCKD